MRTPSDGARSGLPNPSIDRRRPGEKPGGRRRFRPEVSSLEERQLLSTFTVTSFANQGEGSLRWAMTRANTEPGPDTINFSSADFGTRREIRLSSPLPTLTDASRTTIEGPGADRLEINGQGLWQILRVSQGAQATIAGLNLSDGSNHLPEGRVVTGGCAVDNEGNLIVSNCTIQKTKVISTSLGAVYNSGSLDLVGCTLRDNSAYDLKGVGQGGAIVSNGTLVVTNCKVVGNRSPGSGGGIDITGGTLRLSGVKVMDNSAGGLGGGLYLSRGEASVTGSSFGQNKAEDGGGVYDQGGTKLTVSNSVLERNSAESVGFARGAGLATFGDTILTGCTIAENSSENSGGGIYQKGGTTTATNCTIARNNGTDGAGVCNASGTILLTNCTVARNRGTSKLFHSAARGGGLWIDGTANVVNTLIAGNISERREYDDVFGKMNGMNNKIGDRAEDFLSPLRDNGGPTPTMALLPGSPAIGAGVPYSVHAPVVPTTDQRGFPRNGVNDVGAYQSSGN